MPRRQQHDLYLPARYGLFLRLVSYGVAAGDTPSIEEIGVIGVRQMHTSLGTPMKGIVESVRAMQAGTMTLLPAKDSSEVGTYVDYLIQVFQ